MASKVWFDKLAPGDQKIIREAVAEARAYGDRVEDEKNAFYSTELQNKGMEFITPDNKAIRTKAMPAIKKAIGKLAPEVSAEIEKICE